MFTSHAHNEIHGLGVHSSMIHPQPVMEYILALCVSVTTLSTMKITKQWTTCQFMHICGAKHSEFCQYQLRTVSPKLPTIILWFSKQKAEYHRLLCGFCWISTHKFCHKNFHSGDVAAFSWWLWPHSLNTSNARIGYIIWVLPLTVCKVEWTMSVLASRLDGIGISHVYVSAGWPARLECTALVHCCRPCT